MELNLTQDETQNGDGEVLFSSFESVNFTDNMTDDAILQNLLGPKQVCF